MLNNHTTVASMGKPMAILNFSIHAPGLGKNFSHAGFQLNTTYGAANPTPTARKISTMNGALWANAKPSAMLKNGAVQGVARTVASTPLKKCARSAVLRGEISRRVERIVHRASLRTHQTN